MKHYRQAILSEGGLARLFRISNPPLSGDRLVLWHGDGVLRADFLFNELMTGTGSFLCSNDERRRTTVGKNGPTNEVHPAVLLCFGIYWQFFRPL